MRRRQANGSANRLTWVMTVRSARRHSFLISRFPLNTVAGTAPGQGASYNHAACKMTRDVRLRAALANDLAIIAHLLTQCGVTLTEASDMPRLFHVAELNGQIIGCAYGEQYGRTLAVHTVAVLPEFRGRRLATYIVSALLMRARAGGCLNAAVLTNQHPGFFARHGFTLTAVDSLVRETQLPLAVLRSFGERSHYMARQLT